MKRYLLAVVAVLMVLLPGCGDRCTSKETAEFLDQLDDIIGRWDDTNELAGSTARIGLSPVVQQLQGIKNEVNDLEDICTEATELKVQTTEYMDLTIDAYLLFMKEKPDEEITAKFQEARAVMEVAVTLLAQLREYR